MRVHHKRAAVALDLTLPSPNNTLPDAVAAGPLTSATMGPVWVDIATSALAAAFEDVEVGV